MKTVADITVIENDYVLHGRPSLGTAYDAWRARWAAGPGERETALRLCFLDWYSCAEPNELTGLPEDPSEGRMFPELFDYLSAGPEEDDEVLFVLGWMVKELPECCGTRPGPWEELGLVLWRNVQDSLPSSSVFHGRGAYGQYFEHVLNHQGKRQ